MKKKQDEERKGKAFGKPQMIRSQPPKVKKVEQKKQKYTEEQQDMIDYGLQELVEIETALEKMQAEDE